MATTMANYLDQAKSFLKASAPRLALRVAPLALAAVAVSQAATFNVPNNNSLSNSCSGGMSGSLAGTVTNGGAGISLSGTPAITGFNSGNCTLTAVWKGTGSGPLTGGQLSGYFVTTPNNVYTTITGYSLVIKVNGVQQQSVSCTGNIQPTAANGRFRANLTNNSCSGTITIPSTAIATTGTLSTYEADLSVTGQSSNGDYPALFTVSVPYGASIDLTTATAPATVPAMSPAAMLATALLLAAAAARMFSGKASRTQA